MGAYDSTKHVPIHDAIIIILSSRRRGREGKLCRVSELLCDH